MGLIHFGVKMVGSVKGEDDSCKCPPGYIGENCEHPGASCGRIFCFHEAECLTESDVCECPPNWKGSVDCSHPTKNRTGQLSPPTFFMI